MIENNTTDKKIVSLFTGNKLCNVASRLRGKGFNIICPNHDGLCTANLAEDAVIGNETVNSKKCAVEVSDYLKISHITTDGDSKACFYNTWHLLFYFVQFTIMYLKTLI
jgi:hypothetical protein